MDTDSIKTALKSVKFPGFTRDIVSFGLVRDVDLKEGKAHIKVAVTTADQSVPEKIAADIKSAVGELEGIAAVGVEMEVSKPQQQPGPAGSGAGGAQPTAGKAMQKVKFAIAVASGKGGVGKSTVAVNVACALTRLSSDGNSALRVGIMDCDIYGPSVPLMLGVSSQPEVRNEMIMPIENFGVRAMSMGLLIDENTPVIWRGPMIMKTIQQFAQNVDWGELDILIVDLPPGTGDAQLSLVQTLPLEGALIVTTPQAASHNVARRGAGMFEKVSVPVLGVIENMSYLTGPDGTRQALFGEGGGKKTAQQLEVPLLGQVPIESEVRVGSDNGVPVVLSHPESEAAQVFTEIARQIRDKLFVIP